MRWWLVALLVLASPVLLSSARSTPVLGEGAVAEHGEREHNENAAQKKKRLSKERRVKARFDLTSATGKEKYLKFSKAAREKEESTRKEEGQNAQNEREAR